VEKGVQLPIVNVTGVKIFTNLLRAILKVDNKKHNTSLQHSI